MIKGVVFDLDHMLYDRDGCSRAAMDTFYRCFPERFMPGVSREAARELMIQAEHRAIYGGWSAIVAELRRLGVLRESGFTDHDVMDFFQCHYIDHMVPFPFTKPMLDRLRGMNLRLGLITNGNPFYQQKKIAALHYEDEFDSILIGSDPSTAKPHSAIFLQMAELLRCQPSELIYAGDNPVNDVDASRRAGYVPVWVRTITPWQFPEIPECDLQVDTVAEIPDLVEALNRA